MPEITSQAWLIATLTEAGSRLNTVIGAGATDPQVCWTDSDQKCCSGDTSPDEK